MIGSDAAPTRSQRQQPRKPKAIITLVHGTWSREAKWASFDSAICQSIRNKLCNLDTDTEFFAHQWTGRNSVRARQEAALSLAQRLDRNFREHPDAFQFIISHSHGGNIVIDALRTQGLAERVCGVVTMSTPFVSCRRSGIRMATTVLATALMVAFTLLVYWIFFMAASWLWDKVYNIDQEWISWPLLLVIAYFMWNWAFQIGKFPSEILEEISSPAWDAISDWQDAVLDRFDRTVRYPVKIFCVRFLFDEALLTLGVSRLLVKPFRYLTVIFSWMAAAGGLSSLILWALGLVSGFILVLFDLLFGSNLLGYMTSIYNLLWVLSITLLWVSLIPLVVSFIIWIILGYLLSGITLGHWGGIIDQLLVDFRITGAPAGANAVSKIYSPFRWRQTLLLHSLPYMNQNTISEISDWIATCMIEEARDVRMTLK